MFTVLAKASDTELTSAWGSSADWNPGLVHSRGYYSTICNHPKQDTIVYEFKSFRNSGTRSASVWHAIDNYNVTASSELLTWSSPPWGCQYLLRWDQIDSCSQDSCNQFDVLKLKDMYYQDLLPCKWLNATAVTLAMHFNVTGTIYSFCKLLTSLWMSLTYSKKLGYLAS